jgi:hypothetical protein
MVSASAPTMSGGTREAGPEGRLLPATGGRTELSRCCQVTLPRFQS